MSEQIKKQSPWYITALVVLVLIVFSPLIVIIVLLFLIPWLNIKFIQRPKLLREVKKEWLPKHKFILFVYSDNELWKQYAEKNMIPKIASNAVVLNWSHRKEWIHSNTLEARLFRNFQWNRKRIWQKNMRMGGQDYNHLAIIFKPWNQPKILNFWKAFKDYEFGKEEKLKAMESELCSYINNE